MNYLITGSSGFIGTNLVNYLHDKGESIIFLDYEHCDLCEGYPSIINSLHFDVIVHLAAETDVRESIENPGKTFLRNCESTFIMLELARRKGAKFIFASSQAASYCLSPYGASKLACEALIESYRNSYDIKAFILRLANVYGPYSTHKNSVIAKFIKAKLSNKPVEIYGSGEQTRDFIHVSDVCRQLHEADRDLTISTGVLTPINNLAELLEVSVIHTPPVKGEVESPDCHSEISFDYALEEGLAQTLKWFEENYKEVN
jgi:UDP-glucose 4-epimerase